MYFRALKSLFMNLKIKYKLLSAMMGIVLFSCSFMGIICYIYFSDFMEKEAKSETEASLMNTAASWIGILIFSIRILLIWFPIPVLSRP